MRGAPVSQTYRCEGSIGRYPVAGLALRSLSVVLRSVDIMAKVADLVFSGACARPDERIWAQVALDVGRDYFSRDAFTRHKPLICARHG